MQKRWQYLAIEFLAHGVAAAVICAAPNYLAPYFSTARICRLAVYAVCLIAFLLGRINGLFGAKKGVKRGYPYVIYALCALYLAVATFGGKYLSAGVAILYSALFSKGILLACSAIMAAILFGVPCFCLGKASPDLFCAREEEDIFAEEIDTFRAREDHGAVEQTPFRAREEASLQNPSMQKTALLLAGGAGLAAGALLAFMLATKTPVSLLMGAAVTAFLLYALPFTLQGARQLRQSVAFVLIFVCMAGAGSIPYCFIDDEFLVKEYHSPLGYYKVEEQSGATTLSYFAIEGANLQRKKGTLLSGSYATRALAAHFMAGEGTSALCIGAGVGSFAAESAQIGANVTLVERDKRALTLVKTHFGLPQTVTALATDGREYLAKTTACYDVIFVDEYRSFALPQGVTGQEFFRLCAQKTAQGGVICLYLPQAESAYTKGVIAALGVAYPTVYTVQEGDGVLVFGSFFSIEARLYDTLRQAEESGALTYHGMPIASVADGVLSQLWQVYSLLTPVVSAQKPFTDADARSLLLEYSRMEEYIAPAYRTYRQKLKTDGFWELFS